MEETFIDIPTEKLKSLNIRLETVESQLRLTNIMNIIIIGYTLFDYIYFELTFLILYLMVLFFYLFKEFKYRGYINTNNMNINNKMLLIMLFLPLAMGQYSYSGNITHAFPKYGSSFEKIIPRVTPDISCYSIPLSYSNITRCDDNGLCEVKFSSLSSFSGSVGSRACLEYPKINNFANVSQNLGSGYIIAVSVNECQYEVVFDSYGTDNDVNAYAGKCSCNPLSPDVKDCSTITLGDNGRGTTCFQRTAFQKDCPINYATPIIYPGDNRIISIKAEFMTARRFTILRLRNPRRLVSVAVTTIDSNQTTFTNYAWDGASNLENILQDGAVLTLSSSTLQTCPNFINSYFVIDRLAPYDGYIINDAIINPVGRSLIDKMFPMRWDVNDEFRWDSGELDSGQKAFTTTLLSCLSDTVNIAYKGIVSSFELEQLRLSKKSIKNTYPRVLFSIDNDLFTSDLWASNNSTYTHTTYDPLDYKNINNNILNKFQTANIVDIDGTVREVGYYLDNNNEKQCYFNDIGGNYIFNGNFVFKGRDGGNKFLYCGPTTVNGTVYPKNLLFFVILGVNYVNYCQNLTDIYGQLSSLCLYSVYTLKYMTNTLNPRYSLSITPETSSSIVYSLYTTKTINTYNAACCPNLIKLYDNYETGFIEITANTLCRDGPAFITLKAGVAPNPLSVNLISKESKFYYQRNNVSSSSFGVIEIGLCCNAKCVYSNISLQFFPDPYVPEPLKNPNITTTPTTPSAKIKDWFESIPNVFKSITDIFNDLLTFDWSNSLNRFLSLLKIVGLILLGLLVSLLTVGLIYLMVKCCCCIYRSTRKISTVVNDASLLLEDKVKVEEQQKPIKTQIINSSTPPQSPLTKRALKNIFK